jgi:predicted small lipoprotein YifL
MVDLAFKALAVLFATALTLLLGGCGQTGALYLPEDARGTEVVTRPNAPPPSADAPSSPESVDSPATPPSPAPEVTAPEPGEDAEARKKNGVTPPK